jgi:hypothetical protein
MTNHVSARGLSDTGSPTLSSFKSSATRVAGVAPSFDSIAAVSPAETPPFFQAFLSLSQACLGKFSDFQYKMAFMMNGVQKGRFFPRTTR